MNELLEIVEKRELDEWHTLQSRFDAFGRDHEYTNVQLGRWSQWNDIKYIIKAKMNENEKTEKND